MNDGPDREFLLSVFLVEAWDTVSTVEEQLNDPIAALDELRVVTHRLRGSAAMNGFRAVSTVGALMESLVDRLVESPEGALDEARAGLADLLAALKMALDRIAESGEEDPGALEAVLVRHGGVAADAGPAAPPAVPPEAADGLADLDRFFRDNADVLEYFVPEAIEHLELAAQSLLAVERDGPSETEIARLFRAVHTLKGAAYTVGCAVIGGLAHRVEDLLGEVRDGHRALGEAGIEAVNAALDALRHIVRSAERVQPERLDAWQRAARLLDALTAASTAEPAGPVEATPDTVADEPVVLAAEAAPPAPTVVRPSIRVPLDRLDALMSLAGELVIARARLDRHLTQLEHVGELLGFTQARMRQTVGEFETKYANPQLPASGRGTVPGDGATAEPTVVPLDGVFAALEFDRYDDFNILARRSGEIVSDVGEVQAQLAGLVRAVRGDAARVQQLSATLRSEITRSRMVPLGRLFGRFVRQVRETARTAGRQVTLEVAGDAIEVDNAIIDQITDPLLHLIQNAIVHGIEPPDERVARGKPAAGVLRLAATHRGGTLHVEVSDDGRGIDLTAVRASAERAGLTTPGALAQLDDRAVLDLIFLPGVSTVDSVTTVAGRGVGMDVVRTNVGRLGGEIDIETTPGNGVRFSLRLPLTVAVSDALLVRVGATTLAIPVQTVKAMSRVLPAEIVIADDAETVEIEAERLELLRLDRVLGVAGKSADGPLPVVVLRTGRRAVAVAVDDLLGREEVVVKRLGAFMEGCGPYAGATVSPEGQVILLLDAARLADRAGLALRPRPPAAASPAAGPASARTVLLVDDSVSVRKFVAQMLERAGFRVVTANDGGEALERVGETAVDVVVTDLEMPRVNGYELVRDLRRRPATRQVPIIVLTTRTGDKHVRLARQLGVEHYVTKPVDETSFVRLVGRLVADEARVVA